MIKSAAGSRGEIIENFLLCELRLSAIRVLVACGLVGIYGRTSDVATQIGGIEAASVQGVYDDASAIRAINNVHPLEQKSGQNEARRDENQFPLARHAAKTAQGIFDGAIGVIGGGVAAAHGALRGTGRYGTRRGQLSFVAAVCALNGILCGDNQGLHILPVRDEVGLEIRQIGTIVDRGIKQRASDDLIERLF